MPMMYVTRCTPMTLFLHGIVEKKEFYFFYRIFKTYYEEPAFTALLAVFIIFCLYLLSIHKILFHLGYVSKLPVFSIG